MKTTPTLFLNNSAPLPLVGLGTWQLKGEECTQVVQYALAMGYRHIDTAEFYDNHTAIRKALAGFDREKLFLTSKFSLDQLQNESLQKVCERALNELGTEYLDLYLLHYPDRSYNMAEAIQQAFELIEKQRVRAVGVSNFTTRHLQDLIQNGFTPSVNQVEFHPYLNQKKLLAFCQQHSIHLMSFRSLGKGALCADPLLKKIGDKHHKTPAQISLRWLIEQNISVIPKATLKQHLHENLDIFNFNLDSEDKAILDNLDAGLRFCAGEWTDFSYI
jgi:2,5-diketo-D-gluconate reductase B